MSNIQKVDQEENDKKKVIRITLFGVSSFLFIGVIIISIIKLRTGMHPKHDFWTLFILLLFLATSIGSIITNMDRLQEIKTKIKNINENLRTLGTGLPEDESLSYANNLWIFPLVSFIYVCIVIIMLIMLNNKCNYIKLDNTPINYNMPTSMPTNMRNYYNRNYTRYYNRAGYERLA